ncbi:MAG: RluA family pseudouridine synthase [Alphaproteobacteria bacterium]
MFLSTLHAMTGRAQETAAPETHTVAAAAEDRGRLDAFLAARLQALSRSRLKALIVSGAVSADGETIKDPSRPVKPGARYRIAVPAAAPATPAAQDIALAILYEDEHLIVIDKPAGLVVHPAPGNPDRTLVNALIHHCGAGLTGIGGVARPGIVHRLDKDTSGVMVVAKTAAAHESLVAQFAARSIERAYGALVWGVPNPAAGRIEGNIGRSPRNRKKMAVRRSGGRAAVTHYRTVARVGTRASRVECRLETGRTHQIRVHMAHIGHPIVGEPLYGGRRRLSTVPGLVAPHQALHAFRLGFRHPASGEKLRFDAPFPPYFNDLIKFLEKM